MILLTKIHRFLIRLWGTRHAKCDSFLLRCKIVWSTTWRYCWNYNSLACDISIGRKSDDESGGLWDDSRTRN